MICELRTHSDAGFFKTRDLRLHHVQQIHDLLISFDEATHRTFTGKITMQLIRFNNVTLKDGECYTEL